MDGSKRVSIEPLGAGDVDIVKWVLRTAVGWNDPPGLPPLEVAVEHTDIARYHRDWGRPGDFGIRAVRDGRFAGAAFARLFTDDDHGYGYIDASTPELGIAVDSGMRRRGVGRTLMVALADRARELRFARLALSVNNPNPAKRLYEALGYRTVDNDGDSSVMVIDL